MASRNAIVQYLNKELRIKKIKDDSRNGLQFRGTAQVEKIGFSVDCSMQTIEHARKKGCNMLIVHHGYKWKGKKDVLGLIKKYENILKKYDMNLCGYHLPLDVHARYGNNIQIAKILGLTHIKKFGIYHKQIISYAGALSNPMPFERFAAFVKKHINHTIKTVHYGKKNIKTVAIVSGGGGKMWAEAVKKKMDVYLTGELGHSNAVQVQAAQFNAIEAGHYKTEVFGVKALMPVLAKKFGVQTAWIEAPTGF